MCENTTYLVEVNIVPKMGVPIQLGIPAIHRPTAILVPGKDVNQAVLNLLGAPGEVEVVATADRTLDLECLAVILVEALERLDEEEIDGEPDGSTPIRVSAELVISAIRVMYWTLDGWAIPADGPAATRIVIRMRQTYHS